MHFLFLGVILRHPVRMFWTVVITHPLFWSVALLCSGFLGLWAPDFLGRGTAPDKTTWRLPPRWTPGIVYQVALNFAGSLVGWVAVFYLWFYRLSPGFAQTQTFKLEPTDLVVAAIAILGVFGFLPFTASKMTKLGS
jgi:hypothetical protein